MLEDLADGLRKQGLWQKTHLIVTADHGMTRRDPTKIVALADFLKLESFKIANLGATGGINVAPDQKRETLAALANAPHLRAFERSAVPERLYFSNNDRIPDIVLIPDAGWSIALHQPKTGMGSKDLGDHGYDNSETDMGALFIARGPSIPAGQKLPVTDNIHVYNLLSALLCIEPAPNDGDAQLLQILGP